MAAHQLVVADAALRGRPGRWHLGIDEGRITAVTTARGGAVTGGAGLTHSKKARTIKRGPNSNVLVTDGPLAESVEQLSGFFIVTCDEYDALVEAAHVLTRAHPVVEIRPVQEL